MTSRDQLHKWAAYLLGLLPIWLLDAFILPRYPVLGLTPVLLPVAAAAVAVRIWLRPVVRILQALKKL